MFPLRWGATLLSLPPLWAGKLLYILHKPLGVPLLKLAWMVGGDGEAARLVLGALEDMNHAIELRPDMPEYYLLRARVLKGLGRDEEAKTDEEAAASLCEEGKASWIPDDTPAFDRR